MPAHAALQYDPSGFDTRVGEMMGRVMAGETFLRAWIDHAGADPLTGYTPSQAQAFRDQARHLGHEGPVAVAHSASLQPLVDAGALWLADPSLAKYAWERRWFGQDRWSLVGITHTISSHRAMDRIADLLVAPIQPWDALICTSQSVRRVVETVLQAQGDYLAARLGATRMPLPQLPVIPLGVDCDALEHDPAARARWRAELGIGEEDVAILQFGRMSLHMKAHPLPMLQAVAAAADRGGPRLHLIFAGVPSNEGQGQTLRTFAVAFSSKFTTHFVDGARADAGSVRSAADIFTLLSDNIQESFGLAPVEGMAAGLPVVGSDWDGLRDTIEHGVTGLLVPTIMPSPGAGEAIARRHAFGAIDYHKYLAATAQATAVDIRAAADAFVTLAADRTLRHRMGAAARDRARRLYDWRVVIRAYRALLDDLAVRRTAGAGESAPRGPRAPAQPARMDPFTAFAGHASAALAGDTRLIAVPGGPASVDDLPGKYEDVAMVRAVLPPAATLDRVLARLRAQPLTVLEILEGEPTTDRRVLLSGIALLLKYGLAARA